MHILLARALGRGPPSPPWNDGAPVRQELFGIERLEQHAQSLAAAQRVAPRPPPVLSLLRRVEDNAAALLAAYRSSAAEVAAGRSVVPASEWLLDNYHVVEEQIREIRDDLPPGYFRLLPKLAEGPFAGYPRVFGLTWAFVAHTDSHFDPAILKRFIDAYQRVDPLAIGELWAVAITLRIVLVENLRRLADQIVAGREARAAADRLAARLLAPGQATAALEADIATRHPGPLSELFGAQLAKRLRDQDPRITPALGWLEERLRRQGTSIDEAVLHAQQRQGASNVTVRNVITSMRLMSDIDWAGLVESVSLADRQLAAASDFAAMDFQTRNTYRAAIEELGRGSSLPELYIVQRALDAARLTAAATDPTEAARTADPGYHLIGDGRSALERTLGFRTPVTLAMARFMASLGIGGYVTAVLLVALVLTGLAIYALGGSGVWLALFAVALFLPATEAAMTLVDRTVHAGSQARTLPGLDFVDGVPSSCRTLVAVPALLTDEASLLSQIEGLEIHHLSSAGGDLSLALVLDGLDADREVLDADAPLLAVAAAGIAQLNRRHGPAPSGDRFLLLYRRRIFNPAEGRWMGWERKRGKLRELNRLLRGATDTNFVPIAGLGPWVPEGVRYVITLDADTRLPRDAALRIIGKMAHPLNRPRFSRDKQRVVGGYGILQPRVTPSLPVGREGSLYQRVFSGPGGMDPYAGAVSDVFQDLFGEGSYTGKGAYDVDAFEAALAGRVPENRLLSHDLFEGIFARAGLVPDIELIEEFPARYDVIAKRRHRWTRGDWQLLPWVIGQGTGTSRLPSIGRWKMVDNLRRSLLAPSAVLALGISWLLPPAQAIGGTLAVLIALALPAFLPVLFATVPKRSGLRVGSHLRALAGDLRVAAMYSFLSLAFLAHQAWLTGDAVIRTLIRLLVTRRHLLEWTTAAQSTGRPRLAVAGFYREMAWGVALGLAVPLAALVFAPGSWPAALPIGLLWLAAPAIAWWSSRSPPPARLLAVTDAEARSLRLTGRRTWRFFETFVTPADSMLPPDNFQETPVPVVARRTSPTNMGLYLLSTVAARDFGWTGTLDAVDRLEATLRAMQQLPRFNGHFFNWYGTADGRPLEPAYVSSVDSGNLAGHLITIANACEEWIGHQAASGDPQGVADALCLARDAIADLPAAAGELRGALAALLDEVGAWPLQPYAAHDAGCRLGRCAAAARTLVDEAGEGGDVFFWIDAARRAAAGQARDRDAQATSDLDGRLAALAKTARGLAIEMDFAFLLDPERKLLSIGYSTVENGLDPSCYDLLASEARLASLFAIAKGDIATRHWFRLGRAGTPVANGSALLSWSGSMFEYLMPSLVMREPLGSLLHQTCLYVVVRQQAYGRSLALPWGISESAYNARDMELTYQYSNFGVPGLGLKRGLSDNVVVAPYATGLAAMVDPRAAVRNYGRLAEMGALGRYGFYEALDFTRARLPAGEDVAIVRTFMAHHQGMTIVAIANSLQGGRMRERFHREPMIQATELLLQERMPRDVAIAHPRAEEVKASAAEAIATLPTVRRLATPVAGPPVTHLLSNGRYAVMLTASGAGYSRWRDIAVTRWREDPTLDGWGSFIFLRDIRTGRTWSAGTYPLGGEGDQGEVVFGEDHAGFQSRHHVLTTAMDVLVSGEADAEVRRVCLTNSGRRTREIEVTSYAELVLAPPAADDAHQAFAKMFVVTEHLGDAGALLATRRPRSPEDPPIWAAHFVVVEGTTVAKPQYESDRARFLGRGRTVATAAALTDGKPLSNTTGTVLDPIFSLRRRVSLEPGKVARLAFWTVVAASRSELLDLIDRHHDRNAYDRAKTLAWTQAQVQLHHLNIDSQEAANFQSLTAPILYAQGRFRASPDAIRRGIGPQSGLWPLGVSGDLPIVLLRVREMEDMAIVRQLLQAHEYWRMKQLAVDLVILNERSSSYIQDLQVAVETAVRSSQSRPRFGLELAQGAVHALRADQMAEVGRSLLLSVARVVLVAGHGPLTEQLERRRMVEPAPEAAAPARPAAAPGPVTAPPPRNDLEFFNGLGGFDKDGREYVTVLQGGRTTPAPWINVIANESFGFQVAAEGSGYTWAANSRENKLTPWSNDPVTDAPGEALYIQDQVTGELWSPTAQPIRGDGTYVARHGRGYSRFEHDEHGIAAELLQLVPLADPIKISRLVLRNRSGRPRRLAVTAYAEWVLGTGREASAPAIVTEIDTPTGAVLARNAWNPGFPDRVAFVDLGGRQTAWTADRTEFLGRHGSLAAPAALVDRRELSGASGAGIDPCATVQRVVDLGPGATVEVVWLLGQGNSLDDARNLIARYRQADIDDLLQSVTAHWEAVLGAITVRTPDRAMDLMLNGWLLYQTLACRIWARSAFYQSSGAYGFRDQLQDGMALTFARPEETRRHLLRAASRQFVEGDVQHWWLPHSGQGVRTRISDDRVWLAFATATYVARTGDVSVLDEPVPFLEGPALRVGDHDAFFQPDVSGHKASLFEHCARGLDQSIQMTGGHGLPLIGTGDWNDGMSRVGAGDAGESVWLGWLLVRTINLFAALADDRDAARALRWRTHSAAVTEAIEQEAWDGAWYRRATYDDGTWLGSVDSEECRIDSIAQSWAVLSRAAEPTRAAAAMASLEHHLIRRLDRLALLFWPPFDATSRDPGYIKGYPPGLRENGGQYSHAAMWAILAFAELGMGDAAAGLFALLNPINHTDAPAAVERYKGEPYVVAADVYSIAPHAGRAGWTWYTGAAGWMYRAGVEGILGIRREGPDLVVEPCIPASWPGFEATVIVGYARFDITVESPSASGRRGVSRAVLDGTAVACPERRLRIAMQPGKHALLVVV